MLLRFIIVITLITLFSDVTHNYAQASSDLNKRISHLYEKVYADPSNVSLNLELVRSQIQIRDFKGASGTLDSVDTDDDGDGKAFRHIINRG